ncbi:MAG: helix-hairpin-helix domain-containing protein [Deltaproteobacteria bacterium]|nr:helix-hairpin-helix domain-containing protein [Deltaproteobacteria bacterium]
MCLARSFSCQLHTASCSLNLGARGTTFAKEEDRMQQQVKVNINKASVDELSTLKRVGPAYAQRIVDYRKQNGPFEKPEDIMKVRGIGIKTFEANKNFIACE